MRGVIKGDTRSSFVTTKGLGCGLKFLVFGRENVRNSEHQSLKV